MELTANAKINLTLDILRKREDGYHDLQMVMQSVSLADELTVTPARGEAGTAVSDLHFLPTGGKNLAQMAAAAFRAATGLGGEVDVSIRKHVPVCAGLAGGSADAAAVMKGMNRLFDLDAPLSQLMEYGVSIGADVPYCILGGTALAEGIGEKLTPLPPIPACRILAAKPDISVSTRYVYEHLDARGIPCHPDIDGMEAAVRAGDLPGILCRMANVLEAVTVPAHPVISTLKNRMLKLGAEGSLMSGSGPTVFGIFTDPQAALSALEQLQKDGLARQVFLTEPV